LVRLFLNKFFKYNKLIKPFLFFFAHSQKLKSFEMKVLEMKFFVDDDLIGENLEVQLELQEIEDSNLVKVHVIGQKKVRKKKIN